jgi:hypothetical protein
MRRALTWLAGLAGIAALLRRRSRQRAATPQSLPSPPTTDVGDPAVELRQKLQETRTPDPEPPAEVEATFSLDERRARVHERAQDAISQMRSSPDAPAGDEPPDEESTT